MRNPLHPDALRLEDLYNLSRLGKTIAICDMVNRRAEYVTLMSAPVQSGGSHFVRTLEAVKGREEIVVRNLAKTGVVPNGDNKWSDHFVMIDPDNCRDGILDDLVTVKRRTWWAAPDPTSRWDLALDMPSI